MLDQYTRQLYLERLFRGVLIIVPLSLLAVLVAILIAGCSGVRSRGRPGNLKAFGAIALPAMLFASGVAMLLRKL